MTETAGPQGGPPPSAGRGPWSEAFKGETGGGWGGGVGLVGVNTAFSSDTRTPEGEFKSKHLIEHLFLQSQNHCNEAEGGETDESCPVKLCISHAMQDLP